MPVDPVPTGPSDTAPRGFVPNDEQHEQLLAALAAAGVELGEYDKRIAEWLANWEWSTVAVIAGWVKQAAAETDRLRAERDQAMQHRDHWHAETMTATRRIGELEAERRATT